MFKKCNQITKYINSSQISHATASTQLHGKNIILTNTLTNTGEMSPK